MSGGLDEVIAGLATSMQELAPQLFGAPPSRKMGANWRFGTNGSLSVVIAGSDKGKWYDHEAGVGGDALGLVAHLNRMEMREARVWALNWLGMDAAPRATMARFTAPPAPKTAPPAEDGRTSDFAFRVWREATAASGTLVGAYLASRGLQLPEDAPIRFHPACPRGEGEKLPAMVALMTDALTGEPRGIHRTFLAVDGRGKAAGQAKMMAGKAGVIRLVPDEDVTQGLGLAEGIETALSVMQVYGWKPVWAATSAGAIANFPVLPGIECLTVFSDNDESGVGLKAATKCYERWVGAGVEFAGIPCPRVGDWNDVARGGA